MTPFLIEMLEKAPKGSRMLDWAIAEKLGEVPPHSVRTIGWDYDWYRLPGEWSLSKALDSEGRNMTSWMPCPRTTSIDAALEFKPKGWTLANLCENDDKTWHCELREGYLSSYKRVVFGHDHYKAATAALALCIASLRARMEPR